MNICVWLCAICYLFAFFSTYFKVNGEYARYEAIYAEMLKESNEFNDNNKFNNSNNGGVKRETPMFDNATSAIDYAYNHYINSEFSEYEVTGTVVAQAGDISLPVKVLQKQIIYPSGTVLCECRLWVDGNKFNITEANQRIYKKGKVYIRAVKADKMSYNEQTGEITADYANKTFEFESDDDFATFTISKETITRELYFKVNYDPYNGQVKSYSASASIHTRGGVEKYDERIQREGGLTQLPNFTKLEVHFVVGRDGSLQNATINECYSSYKQIPVLGNISYNSSDTLNLKIIGLGTGQPSIEEPKINL